MALSHRESALVARAPIGTHHGRSRSKRPKGEAHSGQQENQSGEPWERPENVVKLSEKLLWVIEAKRSRKQLDVAVEEAIECYAAKINALPGNVRAVMATGVAGTEAASINNLNIYPARRGGRDSIR